MVGVISEEQVVAWLDGKVVQDVQHVTDDETEFNIKLRLARLPLHVIKEDARGPIRLVSNTAFDTERTRKVMENDEDRSELLARIGPVLAVTPGFYTFLDEDGTSCEFADAYSIQLEHRIYPDGASRQATMEGLMNLATAMRYLQNTVAVLLDSRG
ncbi:hypothetical protein ACFFQF_14840 [Haladaptatus pallidirubidus]|uniref:Uncharacterized protein n=1 Tax=Haladaptatus pallidirubidus TaxID=1008152 RepID=A0AAV3UCZ0_9EURY|nr:hypothetical protein [Haladaptatus pallidirubidus]